jgi:hypothetical protein
MDLLWNYLGTIMELSRNWRTARVLLAWQWLQGAVVARPLPPEKRLFPVVAHGPSGALAGRLA